MRRLGSLKPHIPYRLQRKYRQRAKSRPNFCYVCFPSNVTLSKYVQVALNSPTLAHLWYVLSISGRRQWIIRYGNPALYLLLRDCVAIGRQLRLADKQAQAIKRLRAKARSLSVSNTRLRQKRARKARDNNTRSSS